MKVIDVICEQKCLSLAEIEHDMNLLDIAHFFVQNWRYHCICFHVKNQRNLSPCGLSAAVIGF